MRRLAFSTEIKRRRDGEIGKEKGWWDSCAGRMAFCERTIMCCSYVKVLIHLEHQRRRACLMGVVLTRSQPTSHGDCSL